jgi:beta-glucosidase
VLVRLGITPLATLHHFVHPQWFEDIGAFEKEENIPLYLTWVELAFRRAQTGAV